MQGEEKKYNIGIDIGMTSCTVSAFVNNRVQTIPIDSGSKYSPSAIYLGDNSLFVGRIAKLKQLEEPRRVIYGMKRMLGHFYSDPEFQMDLKDYPFFVEKDDKDVIIIKDDDTEDATQYSPVELTAMLISKGIKAASDYLGGEINEIVLTVPAYFNNLQRNDMINAGCVAGIDRVHLLSEPTAAAIAYGLVNTSRDETVLVFDLGGGTLDVSLIGIRSNSYTVISCSGDSHFGGNDITENLLREIVKEFDSMHDVKIEESVTDLMMLRNYVEEAKINLSTVESYDIDIEDLMGFEYHRTMTRTFLENCNRDFFASCYQRIDEVLGKAYISKEKVTRVILIGGCSATPCIRDHIISMFGKEKVWNTINSNEVVSRGAAIVAGVSHDVTEKNRDFTVSMYATTRNFGNSMSLEVNDLTPMDLGIRVSDGTLSPIILANSCFPLTSRKQYQAHRNYQKYLRFKIYQGCDRMADNCKLISEIVVTIDSPGKINETRVEVEFSLDSNSTLYVQATELKTGKRVEKVIDMGSLVLEEEEIEAMRKSLNQSMTLAQKTEREDIARRNLSRSIVQSQHYLESRSEGDDIEGKRKLLENYIQWLNSHQSATAEDYEQMNSELDNQFSNLKFVVCFTLVGIPYRYGIIAVGFGISFPITESPIPLFPFFGTHILSQNKETSS